MTGDVARRRWLTRNLKIVSGVSFLQDTASEMLYPILPIFLTVTLGAPTATVGAVEGLAEGAAAVTKLAGGGLSDRFRRVPLIGLGYGMAAAGKVLVAIATGWPLVLAGRCVDRLGKGMRSAPRDALIADGVEQRARGRAFGFHRAMDTAGAVTGPLAGLALYQLLDQRIRPLLLLAVIPAVASVLLVAALRDTRPAAGALRTRPTATSVQRGLLRPLPRRYWNVVAALTVFSLVNFPDALLLLRLHDIGFSVTAVIGAYITYNTVYALLSYPAGAIADRIPPAAVLGTGLALFTLTYLGLGLTHSHPVAWLLLTTYGGFTALTDGVGRAWISRLVPVGAQGIGQGVFQCLAGFGVLIAGIWAGLAWGPDGTLPLVLSGTVAGILAIGLLTAAVLSVTTGGQRPGGGTGSPARRS